MDEKSVVGARFTVDRHPASLSPVLSFFVCVFLFVPSVVLFLLIFFVFLFLYFFFRVCAFQLLSTAQSST